MAIDIMTKVFLRPDGPSYSIIKRQPTAQNETYINAGLKKTHLKIKIIILLRSGVIGTPLHGPRVSNRCKRALGLSHHKSA